MASTQARRVIGAAWTAGVGAAVGMVAFASAGGAGNPASGSRALMAGNGNASAVRYDRDIRPLLSDRCFKCHGPDAGTRRAELRLDQFDSATGSANGVAAIVSGDVEGSELWKRINSTDAEEQMPPPQANKRALTAEEKDLLKRWIAGGAAYEPHWSFVPPVKPTAADVQDEAWGKNEIDRFVLARLEKEGIRPAPEADRETLVRRVFLDLTGLPPTPEEVDGYLKDVEEEKGKEHGQGARGPSGAYERLVDRLLNEEPYRSRMAERLATPWMDAARYADTCGIHTDNGRQMWAWRDWVLAAYRENMPYDRFVVEQLAGDLLPNATTEQRVASGFNRNHVTTDEGGAIAEEYLVEYAVDRASTTATAFLGLTMGCARCHDHKFDPISHEEFYGFYAFFNSIEEPGLYTQTPDANRAHEPFMEVPTQAQREKLDALGREIADLRKMLEQATPEEESGYRAFMEGVARETGVAWADTEVVSAKPESAATLTVKEDRSVLASGANPPADVHEITLHTKEVADAGGGLRLLLLEALADASLPNGRVGRALNGNAVLTGIEVESFRREEPEKAKKHEVQWLWADLSQMDGDYRFTNLLVNGKGADRGWAVDGHRTAGDRHLMVLLDEPIPSTPETNVRVRLRYESVHAQHVLGRVRLTLGSIADISRLPTEMSNFWLAGPFPTGGKPDLYKEDFGPETATSIDFTQNFGSGNQFWRYDPAIKDGTVGLLSDGVNHTYLGRIIVTPVARSVPVSLGSDDGFVLYLNGKEVARRQIERGVAADQDKATLELQPGRNVVVLKIVNSGGAAGYYFQPKPKMGDEQWPHALAGALMPASCRTPASDGAIKQAWRASKSPQYGERERRVEQLTRDSDEVRAKVARTMVMKELAMPRETFVLNRGQYDQPDKARPVQRGVPVALGKLAADAPTNRLGLARWIVSPENPLAARVAMNRMWEMVFGAGLVRTSEDFGYQGEWPSHPELLDFLAADFREHGWDMRRMLRMMVTSATYRQSSAPRGDLAERDPENRLLARMSRRRLSAEQTRDQALYVSGLLMEKFGGPSVKTYQPDGLWGEGALPASNTKVYERGKGEDLYRRTLYGYWKRAAPSPDMQAFDVPTREYCVVRRPVTVTPLQALVLWNDPAFVEASRMLAQRTLSQEGNDAARLTMLFRRCTGRTPTGKELESLTSSLAAARSRYAAAADDAAKLMAVGETPVSEKMDKPELASWTMIAGAVMNLYRTTTQE